MPDQQPQNQPQPKPSQDWNEVSVQEIEQSLSSASELAYELAGNIGQSPGQPRIRDASGLESIETALDVELKHIDHLVGKTKEQLEDAPPPPAGERKRTAAPIPDFMSEFLSDEPVTVLPEAAPRALAEATGEGGSSATSRSGGGSAPSGAASVSRGSLQEPASKAGLIDVGTLGRPQIPHAPKPNKTKAQEPAKTSPRSGWAKLVEGPLYLVCDRTIHLLELLDRPFARLAPTTRRALNVTAIAALCVCLAMFVLSWLMS